LFERTVAAVLQLVVSLWKKIQPTVCTTGLGPAPAHAHPQGNTVIKSSSERIGFSKRLQQCLRNSHHSPESPTELAREFNIRFPGQAITVHAARKWLVGEAIPTQDKLRTLADWMQVPIDWLRFGGDEQQVKSFEPLNALRSADLKLIADMQLLDEHHRSIVREFIRIIVRTHSQQQKLGAAQVDGAEAAVAEVVKQIES
jgi:NOL1/NOP2/fmu family ribosome biogenesis protein